MLLLWFYCAFCLNFFMKTNINIKWRTLVKYTATSSIYSNVLEDQCLDFLSSIVTWLLRSDSHVQGRCMGRTRVCVKMCTSDVYIASSVCLSCTCIYLIIDGCHKLALLVNSHTLNGRIWFRHLLSDMVNPFANLKTESLQKCKA